eukprot:7891640-Prorocentrum_lima.AAC.1
MGPPGWSHESRFRLFRLWRIVGEWAEPIDDGNGTGRVGLPHGPHHDWQWQWHCAGAGVTTATGAAAAPPAALEARTA